MAASGPGVLAPLPSTVRVGALERFCAALEAGRRLANPAVRLCTLLDLAIPSVCAKALCVLETQPRWRC